jgi:hypothetical protein
LSGSCSSGALVTGHNRRLSSGTEEKQMPSLRSLVPEQRTLDFDFGDGATVRIVYDPREVTYTPEEIEARRDSEDVRNANAEDLARAVIEWDITGPVPVKATKTHAVGSLVPENETIPLDAEIISYLPFEVVATLVMAVTLDGQPDPTKTARKLQKRGSTRTSMRSNGRQEEPSHSPVMS